MLKVRHLLFLACVVPATGLCHGDSASAAFFGKGAAAFSRPLAGRALGRPFAGRPPALGPRAIAPPHGAFPQRDRAFNGPPGATPRQQFSHGFDRGPARQGRAFQHGLEHGPAVTTHAPLRNPSPLGSPGINAIARNGLPHRPLPGEAGFTGVPPRGETRFISNEMVVHVGSEVSPQVLNAAARRLGLIQIESQNLALSGGRLVHFRIPSGQVAEVVRTLEAEKIGVAQPNYIFQLQQDIHVAAPLPKGDPAQYVIDKLHLRDAHGIASGASVSVAVIDSLIDVGHPDLAGSIAGQFDAVATADKPDEHGTGMTGAIAAHRRLLGVAPGARILAIHAFSPDAQRPQQATTQNIIAGIDWAIAKGARVINMSFAGPDDPMLQLALQRAHDKGVVLIAAAGNLGAKSPPLYPAADPNVIAVTATDAKDQLLAQANQGPYVALAAPGVDVLEPAPDGGFQKTTGTSVAAAHVSGIVALMLDRDPSLDAAAVRDILTSSAKHHAPNGRDDQFGWGLVDPYRALTAPDPRVARDRSHDLVTPSGAVIPRPMSAR
jgi:subtilisin family serine protease